MEKYRERNELAVSILAVVMLNFPCIYFFLLYRYYDSQVTCEQSPQNPSIFNWIPDSHCYPANIGVGNTPGGLQYTSCSANTYTIVGYADVNCTQLLHSYEEIPRPICVIGEYGNDHDDDAVQDSSHVDDYETLTCNV